MLHNGVYQLYNWFDIANLMYIFMFKLVEVELILTILYG